MLLKHSVLPQRLVSCALDQIKNQESEIRDQRSEIKDQKPEIRDRDQRPESCNLGEDPSLDNSNSA